MNTSRAKLVLLSALALALGAAVVAWALARPPISVTVLTYTTNRLSDERAAHLGTNTYVCAVVGIKNHSSRAVTYDAAGCLMVLQETPRGWEVQSGSHYSISAQNTLWPHHGFTSEVVVGFDKRYKVQFVYSHGRSRGTWRQLPSWLTQRLPWSQPSNTVATAPIDLRQPRN